MNGTIADELSGYHFQPYGHELVVVQVYTGQVKKICASDAASISFMSKMSAFRISEA